MTIRSNTNDWGSIAKALHWAMAIGIVIMIACGVAMRWLLAHNIGLKFSVFQFHKSLGFVLLCLAICRLCWRILAREIPSGVADVPPYQRRAASVVHSALYACLIAQPITGWLLASASPLNIPTEVFGMLTLPRLVGPSASVESVLSLAHAAIASTLTFLIALHVAAAVWHHFVLRDRTLLRMMPWTISKQIEDQP